jgi:hypothetical protein
MIAPQPFGRFDAKRRRPLRREKATVYVFLMEATLNSDAPSPKTT